ncbi:MAG: hypothetical protein ACR2MN_01175 [Acidimicrobiales bacterium]
MASVGVDRTRRGWLRPDKSAPAALGLVLAAIAIVIAATQTFLRRVEALVAAFVLGRTHLVPHARAVGTAVLVPQTRHVIAIELAPGLASAMLLVPFVLITGALLARGLFGPSRALLTLAGVALIVVVTNQARLAAVGAAMRVWGVHNGYTPGHVVIDTLLPSFGVACGVVAFVVSFTHATAGDVSRQPARSRGGSLS